MEQRTKRITEIFRKTRLPLYAILDAAKSEDILMCLCQREERFESLYEGQKAGDWAEVAPYLVDLSLGSDLLPALIEEGWGDNWGIYLASDAEFDSLRNHFRRFLIVDSEEFGQVFFRFYDPRVLRAIMPTFAPDERLELFGPVDYFLTESKSPDNLSVFRYEKKGKFIEDCIKL